MINYTCPHCQTLLSAPEQFAGQAGTCRHCGKPIVIPAPGAEPAAPSPTAVQRGPSPAVFGASEASRISKGTGLAMLSATILLLALFVVLFIGWVAPRARGSGQVFTMAMPLAMLVIVVLILIGVIAFRKRIRSFLAEFTGLAKPDSGPPWQAWGQKNALRCPHCGVAVAPPSPEQLAQVIATMGQREEATVPYRCTSCRAYWEARLALGTTRQAAGTVLYDWRPLAATAPGTVFVEAGPARLAAPGAGGPFPVQQASRHDSLRKEALRILSHYQEEARTKLGSEGAADPAAIRRIARQQAMRVMMQRHGLGPDEVTALFPD